MKKSILTLLISSLFLAPMGYGAENKKIVLDEDEDENAIALISKSKNKFKKGDVVLTPQFEIKVGGDWMQRKDEDEVNDNPLYDDGREQDFLNKSYVTSRMLIKDGNLFGYAQVRFNTNHSDKYLNAGQDQLAVSYAYIGYSFEQFGQLSVGTLKPAMSHIKNISVTPGLNASSESAGTADSSIKYENELSDFSVKLSYSKDYEYLYKCSVENDCKHEDDKVDLYSGNLMYNNGTVMLAAGMEQRSNDSEIITGGGILSLGKMKFAANYFQQNIVYGTKDDALENRRSKGGSFSGRYTLNKALYLSGGYSYENFYNKTGDIINSDLIGDQSFATVGGQYRFSKSATLKFAYQKGLNSFTRDKIYARINLIY